MSESVARPPYKPLNFSSSASAVPWIVAESVSIRVVVRVKSDPVQFHSIRKALCSASMSWTSSPTCTELVSSSVATVAESASTRVARLNPSAPSA